MKTLFVHIGTGKTGTTSIQDFMFDNRDELIKQGFKYCSSGAAGSCHHLLCKNFLRNDSEVQSKIDLSLLDLVDEIKDSDLDTFLISSENFPDLTPAEVSHFVSIFSGICSVKVLVYLRRQDEYIESWYAQVVKSQRTTESIDELKERLTKSGLLNYESMLERWRVEVGQENIIVRPYEKESFHKSSLLKDFVNVLDISDESLMYPPVYSNLSLSREQATFAHAISSYLPEDLQNLVFKPINIGFKGDKFFMSPQQRENILNDVEDSNARVAAKYTNCSVLFKNLTVSKEWKPVDIIASGFLERFVYHLVLLDNSLLERIEPYLIQYLKDSSSRFEVENILTSIKYLQLALLVRPNGPYIISKLKTLLTKLKD